ncbi:MAG TPA: hypothetical protein VK548_25870, partial [Candidatus Acidoferrum sp.]|nr:hypothetical protein [Candidatus Acidoferrum sp.]
LNNLGGHLSDLGRFEEALERAREAHAIYARLAEARPLRWADSLLTSGLWTQFLEWHAGSGDRRILASWPDRAARAELRAHRRPLLLGWHAMVEACFEDRDRAGSGIEKMRVVANTFATMVPHQREPLELYHLLATAYLVRYAPPSPECRAAYAQAWQDFLNTHGNRMPAIVTETLKKLKCAPPESG